MNQEAIASEEKRAFPRMESSCKVLYAIGSSKRWITADMKNISATGICIIADEQLIKNVNISVITKPGRNKVIPEITASGLIAHCHPVGDNQYLVGCKFLKVKPTISHQDASLNMSPQL